MPVAGKRHCDHARRPPVGSLPGEIATIVSRNSSVIPNRPTSLGGMRSIRLDVAALGLVRLRLEKQHTWDPKERNTGANRTNLAGQ